MLDMTMTSVTPLTYILTIKTTNFSESSQTSQN